MRETKATEHQGENSKENKSILEKELVASEIRYRRLFESAKDGILILDAETGKIADVNPFLLDLLGYTKQDLIDRSIWELGTFHDIFENKEKFLELQQEEYVRYDDLPLVTSDGRKISVEFVSNSYTEGNKKVIQCNIRDTTIERQSELALRKSESHLRALVNTIPDLIWLKDTNGVYLSCNPMFERFFGARVTDIIGKTDYDFVDRELSDFFRENDRKALEAGKPVSNEEWVTFADDGHRAYLDTIKSPIYDSDGTLFGILGIGRDITERKLAEQKLHASEKRFRAIFDQAPIAIALVDLQGHPILSNLRFSKMLGYTKDELSKMMFTEFTHPEDIEKDLNQFSDLIAGKISSYNMEKRYIHKNKNLIWANLFITTLNDDNGLPQEIIGMVEDITERKRSEMELIEAKEKAEESDRLKTAFLANMSHEIRTPMNGILGFTDLLLEPDLSSEEKEEYINIVKQSGQRMLNTVNDIVEISKIEAGIIIVDLKEVDIQVRLDELIRFFTPEATKKGLELTLENEAPKTAATITTDQNKFDSILTNLIKNAIKYTESGTIKVGCTVETHGHASLQFYVKDTGIGIPEERQKAIFERFVQAELTNSRQFDGSGLGLAITKAYVDMLGGEIGLESRIGQGSTFFFTLPINGQAQEKTAENKTRKQNEKTSQLKKLSIIIAEDDYNSALYLKTILKKGNYTITLTKNGHETVEACRINPGVDLVLMDIQMPGMNGYDATREIRKFNKEVIIIAQTAYGLSGDREKALEAGCNDYLAKPITKGVLLEKIQKYFY